MFQRVPMPEPHIRLTTIDGWVIERRLGDLSQELRNEKGGYVTASGNYYEPGFGRNPVVYWAGAIWSANW